jgi:hypothetical protein
MRVQIALYCLSCMLAAIALTPGLAHAERELVLTWHAAPECPDADWALRRLGERLGRPLADRESTLRATATLRKQGDRYLLSLHTEQDEVIGDRTLAAQSCDELAEATVLVLALAIDPEAVARVDEGVPAPAPVAEPDSERPPFLTPQPKPAPRAHARSPRSWSVRADALVPLGPLPGFTAGASLALAHEWSRFRAELSGYWLLPSEGRDEPGEGRVRVSLWALRPTVCARLFGHKAQLSACAALELGQISGRGVGLPAAQESHTLWPAASIAPRLSIALGKVVFLVAEAGVVAPFIRPRFVSTDAQGRALQPLYEAAPVTGRATLGLELRF